MTTPRSGTLIVLTLMLATSVGSRVASAGANNARLDCKSVDQNKKRVRLHGDVPGDFAEFSLTLEVGDSSITMSMPDDKIEVVTELSKGVFTLAVALADGRPLKLYAIPTSLKVKGGSRRLFDASFDAVLLEAPKPGYVGPLTAASMTKDVKLTCTLKHDI